MALFQITSLRHKFLLGAAGGLITLSLALLGLAAALYQHQLKQERGQASREVNHLLQAALENAMLKRDLPGLREIISQLGRQSGVRGAMIVTPSGEIRFSSQPGQLGLRFPLQEYEICLKCPQQEGTQTPLTAEFTLDSLGREVMRSLNPVANKPKCAGCHGSVAENPINGVLVVDYDAAPIRRQAVISAMGLAGMGGLLLLATLLGGAWFIHRFVLRPVACLANASRALASGHLEIRTQIDGKDELSELGHTFDQMAEKLQLQMRRVQEHESFLQALVDAIPDGIRVIDREDYRIVLDNQAYRDQIGLPPGRDHRGLSCHLSGFGQPKPCPPSMAFCPMHEISLSGQPCKSLVKFARLDGSERQVEMFAAPMQAYVDGVERRYIVESCRDLEKALKFSQEQKLAEMARLATGVAHEIHNPLASIRIALHATLRATERDAEGYAEIREYLLMVDGEIDRCIDVTERLLKLGMSPSATPQLVSVNPAVEETLSLLSWQARECKASITTRLEIPTPRILGSDSELRAIVLNLAQNALHAMPNGGSLDVTTHQSDGWVKITFEDTGVGITAEDAQRIFDPFFSHRADGQSGTGLGLSICRAIAEAYGGKIEFQSQPGQGSRFTLSLPEASTRLP